MAAERLASGFRWVICGLVCVAVAINYLDRNLFSQLVPYFEDDLKLGPTDLALINVSFILPYGLAMVFVGRGIDRAGLRRGLSVAYLLWNLASLAHAFVGSLFGFMGVRFLLGVGESAMYPSGVKAMADWFPRKERALGTGIFNGGANFGSIIAPIVGIYLATHFGPHGWRICFLITGAAGLIWLFFWYTMYRSPQEHPKVSPSELAYIESDHETPTPRLSFQQLLAIKEVYGLGIAKAMTDAPLWFYMFWLPKFLADQFHAGPTMMMVAIPIVYIVADIGSIVGGWASSSMIKRGVPVGRARKSIMFTCALAVAPVSAVGFLVDHGPILGVPSVYWMIGLISLAAGAHQGWSTNLFTLISDTIPQSSVGLAVGAINGFAMIGVSAMQLFVGWCVQMTSSYVWPFLLAGSLYLLAFGVLVLFMPQVQQARTDRLASMPWVMTGVAALLGVLVWMQYASSAPPYASISDYLATRGPQIHATGEGIPGPTASVGWMKAQWFLWPLPGRKVKNELIKLDTHGHPFVESKGIKAAKYHGPVSGLS